MVGNNEPSSLALASRIGQHRLNLFLVKEFRRNTTKDNEKERIGEREREKGEKKE